MKRPRPRPNTSRLIVIAVLALGVACTSLYAAGGYSQGTAPYVSSSIATNLPVGGYILFSDGTMNYWGLFSPAVTNMARKSLTLAPGPAAGEILWTDGTTNYWLKFTAINNTYSAGTTQDFSSAVAKIATAVVGTSPVTLSQMNSSNATQTTTITNWVTAQGFHNTTNLTGNGITSNRMATATDTAYRNPTSYNAGALTGNVPVAVEQTISHTNLAGVNGAANVQHLTAAEKNAATGAVTISRLPSYIPTNALAVVESTSNQFVMVGRQIRSTVRTNYPSMAQATNTTGNWTGTFDGQEGTWYRNWGVNSTNRAMSYLQNPLANWTNNMANKVWTILFTNPNGGFEYRWQGAASGHLFELIQETGNPPAGTHLFEVRANDPDVVGGHFHHYDANGYALEVCGLALFSNSVTLLEAGDATNDAVRVGQMNATNTAHLAASDPHTGYVLANGSRAMNTLTVKTNVNIGGTLTVTGNVNGCGNTWSNFTANATWGSAATDLDGTSQITNRPRDFIYSGPVTNLKYEVYWFGREPNAVTLDWAWAQTDNGTVKVRIVEKATNAAYRAYTTNRTLSVTTGSILSNSFADATIAAGSMLGMKFDTLSGVTNVSVKVYGRSN